MSGTLTFDAYTAGLTIATTAMPSVVVYDGPQVVIPTDEDYLLYGCQDPLAAGMVNAIDSGSQDEIQLGMHQRDEHFRIWCVLVAWSGETDLAALRARAQANVVLFDTALRPPPGGTGDGMLNATLNQGGLGTGWSSGCTITRIDQVQSTSGAAVHVQFGIDCYARI